MHKMEISHSSISLFLTLSFVLLLCNIFSFTGAHELTLQGNIGDKSISRFSSVEKDIKLVCKFGGGEQVDPKWSFRRQGSGVDNKYVDVCKDGENSSEERDGDHPEPDCDKEEGQLVLKLKKIERSAFGEYVCHTGNTTMTAGGKHFTVFLKELVHLSRRTEKGKLKTTSEIVDVGQTLHLFCNETGLQPKIHRISWFRNGEENITEQLNGGSGLFESFKMSNKTDAGGVVRLGDGLAFEGTALMEHRGNYTCQVDLIDKDHDEDLKMNYPVKHTFLVRVKEGGEWKLPVYVLLGECAVIGLFTLFINWREKNVNEDDIKIEDSEDEDDDQDSKNKNGTQNNNSNGK